MRKKSCFLLPIVIGLGGDGKGIAHKPLSKLFIFPFCWKNVITEKALFLSIDKTKTNRQGL